MFPALTITVRPDGSQYASPPFPNRIEVDRDAWVDLFDANPRLELEAANGDPVVYLLEEDSDPMVFVREIL